jgi:hypothetical protein
MARQYHSFLIRYWYLDEHQQRIKIEHIQSGQATVVVTLADALIWLNEQLDGSMTHQRADSTSEGSVPMKEIEL